MARLYCHYEIQVGAALASRAECVIRPRSQALALLLCKTDQQIVGQMALEQLLQDGQALSDTARPRSPIFNENSL